MAALERLICDYRIRWALRLFKAGNVVTMEVPADWWKSMFDEVYLVTDARSVCDKDITRREVDLICRLIPLRRGHKILDLCGGHGRHSLELCARGFRHCTVLDYSACLIDRARSEAEACNHPMECVQADARDTGLSAGSFDHVLIMGNSLGYIPGSFADREILAEAMRVLRSGGWLLVDVTDGEKVKDSFAPRAWHEIGADVVVCRERWLDGDVLSAREMVLSKTKGMVRDRTYAIRLYDSRSLEDMVALAGFRHVAIHTGSFLNQSKDDLGFMNCRMVAAGQKP